MDPFLAEIRIFPFNYAPRTWALCNGQTMPVSQNTALFSLLGVTYGGDGKTTFGLPNMQGNAPMAPGSGPGLSPRSLGERGGTQTVTLQLNQMPQHNHSLMAAIQPAPTPIAPTGAGLARASAAFYQTSNANLAQMSNQAVVSNGNNQPHNNMMPYLTLNFCIALAGVYPPRP